MTESATATEPPPPTSGSSHSLGYQPPEWHGRPGAGEPEITMDIIRNGVAMGSLDLTKGGLKDYYTFGRMMGSVDILLEHPTASRLHAVIQFKKDGTLYLYDNGSTHGTILNRKRIPPKEFIELHVGDLLQFGQSARIYLLNGPEELRPPEIETEEMRVTRQRRSEREEKRRQEKEAKDVTISGISWGLDEDAQEEEEEANGDEKEGEEGGSKGKQELPDYLKNLPEYGKPKEGFTPTLTQDEVHEKDRKLFEKLRAKTTKIDNMQLEITRIYAKESSQDGGLTEGQRAAVTRNEERIAQLREEIEGLEDQIRGKNAQRQSASAGGGGKKRKGGEEDESTTGDEEGDEFYDRTAMTSKGNWRAKKRPHRQLGRHGAPDTSKAETYESLCARLEALKEDLEGLDATFEPPVEVGQKTVPQSGDDVLDSYMAENEKRSHEQAIQAKQNRRKELIKEIAKVKALVRIAKPALSELHTKGVVVPASPRDHPKEKEAVPPPLHLDHPPPPSDHLPGEHPHPAVAEPAKTVDVLLHGEVVDEDAPPALLVDTTEPPPPPSSTEPPASPSDKKMAPPTSPVTKKGPGAPPVPPLTPLPPPAAEEQDHAAATPPPAAKRVLGPAGPPPPQPSKVVKGPAMPPPSTNSTTHKEKRAPEAQKPQGPPKKMKRDLNEDVEVTAESEEAFVPLFQPKEQSNERQKQLREKYGY